MDSVIQPPPELRVSTNDPQSTSGLFSSESVLNILRLILAGAPLADVLTIIAQLVESQGAGTLCTVWLPHDDGKHLVCAAAPSLPGFIADAGSMAIGPKGGSCGTAVYRKEPVYVSDILTDPVWDHYRDRLLPFGIGSSVVAATVYDRRPGSGKIRHSLSRSAHPGRRRVAIDRERESYCRNCN